MIGPLACRRLPPPPNLKPQPEEFQDRLTAAVHARRMETHSGCVAVSQGLFETAGEPERVRLHSGRTRSPLRPRLRLESGVCLSV